MSMIASNPFEALADSLAEDPDIDMQALIDELCRGENLQRVKVMARDHAQAEVRTQRNPGVAGIGYVSAEIPQEAYMDWAMRHPGCWQDGGFRKDMQRKNPQWFRKYQPKAQTGYTGALDRSRGGLFLATQYTPLSA